MPQYNVLEEVSARINQTAEKLADLSKDLTGKDAPEVAYLDSILIYLGKALDVKEVDINDTEALVSILPDLETVALAVMTLVPVLKNIPPVDSLSIPKPKLIDPLDTAAIAAQAASELEVTERSRTALLDSVQTVLSRYGHPTTTTPFKTWLASLVDAHAKLQAGDVSLAQEQDTPAPTEQPELTR